MERKVDTASALPWFLDVEQAINCDFDQTLSKAKKLISCAVLSSLLAAIDLPAIGKHCG